MFSYKSIQGMIPTYLHFLLNWKDESHHFHSMEVRQFGVLVVQTELGKKAFRFLAPNAWNNLQTDL